MPKPTRFRAIQYNIAGRHIEIAGLARPGLQNKQSVNEVVTYLNKHRFNTLISLEHETKHKGLKKEISKTPEMDYIEKYTVEDFHPPSIDNLENIYKIVRQNALQGKQTAVHCAAGLGRTGSVLAAFKLKERMLAMSDSELNDSLNAPNVKVKLGQYAQGYERKNPDARSCSVLVKEAIETIRSQGGSYQIDYVENEDQVDRLCEYQKYLVQTILKQRKALNQACEAGDITQINELIAEGAVPTQAQFAQAYAQGNIAVMQALIEGGILPTAQMVEKVSQPDNIQSQFFLEIAVLVGQLEAKFVALNQLPLDEATQALKQTMDHVLQGVKEYCSHWTAEAVPSGSQIQKVIQLLDGVRVSKLADHRGLIRTTPVLREIVMIFDVVINSLSLVLKKIYKFFVQDKSPVYSQGLKGVLEQPATDTIHKVKALRDKIHALKESSKAPEESNNTEIKNAPDKH